MLSLLNIRTVARFEIKTLLRSWFFRIFSILILFILGFFDLMVVTDAGANPPWMFRAIPSSIPYFNLLIFNLVQAVIIVFLASDFLKRDKKLDTTDVIYIRSMSNGDYVIGKTLGVFAVFFMLNLAVLLLAMIFNFAQADTPILWEAYFYYPLIISLPTLFFITGLSFLMMVILRNQAITFIILLGYIACTLFFLTDKYNFVLDYMAFKLPLLYSDFVGFGNLKEILIQRGIYFFAGIGFIFLTILLIKRLPQSKGMTSLSYIFTTVLIACSLYLAWTHTSNYRVISKQKEKMIALNNQLRNVSILSIDEYHLDIVHEGSFIQATSTMQYTNNSSSPIDNIIFNLNPSLVVEKFSLNGQTVTFEREQHIISAKTGTAIQPGIKGEITIIYQGSIDDQLCYIDIDDEDYERNYGIAMMNIDKRYGFISDDFVLLTPEVMWYPVAGATYSPENPTYHHKEFSRYSIKVKTREGLKVISQGKKSVNTDGSVSYSEALPLPQISLTIGEYIEKNLLLDSINVSLYYLEGHDFYSPYITELSDTLAPIIKEIKADYELDLNLDYFYKNMSIVEVPIQFFSYSRRWASYQEVVQPQVVLIPEKCANIRLADLKGTYKREKKRNDNSNEALSEKELQARILNRFLSGTFTKAFGGGRFGNFNRGNQQDFAREFTQSSIYEVFPNYYSYIYHVKSGDWSVLDQAFESYITGDNEDMMSIIRRRMGGLTGEENANQALLDKSFEEILKTEDDKNLMNDIIKAKGNYLFALIQYHIGIENFASFLSSILRAHKFQGLDIEIFNQKLKKEYGFDLEPYLESWLKGKQIPGFLLSNINAHEIRDGENTRYQVLFTISNEEPVEGLATVAFRIVSNFRGFGGGPPSLELEKIIRLEPHQKKEIGIVLDGEPRMMAVNTLVSRNIPSAISHIFNKIDLDEKMQPFDGERIVEKPPAPDESFEIIVDNEDDGFELIEPVIESPLKKWLNIKEEQNEDKYVGIRFNRPPNSWKATAMPQFYGKYVLSAYVTAKGDGSRRAIWNATIQETGMHEVYCYIGRTPARGRGGPGGRRGGGEQPDVNQQGQNKDQGSYLFTVHHDDGVDDINIDIATAEEGWNMIGTFYLSTGPAKVELSNETDGNMVIADAIKWVKVQ